jgi:hypothetical protein
MSELRYHIHNTTRSQATRVTRAAGARRSKTVLLLGGGSVRVLRGRPVAVAESTVRRLHAELVQKYSQGLLKVTTPRGDLVDLTTLKPLVSAPKPAPKPHPPVDSINNDKNEGVGIKVPRLEGNVSADAQVEPPRVGRRAIPEGEKPKLLQKEEEPAPAPEPPPEPAPEPPVAEPEAPAPEEPSTDEEAAEGRATNPDIPNQSERKGSRRKTGRRR